MVKNIDAECCPHCGRKSTANYKGRRLTLSDEQLEAILWHHLSPNPKPTIKVFCEQAKISRQTYWRICNVKLKNDDDNSKIIKIAVSVSERLRCNIHGVAGIEEREMPI